VRWRVALGTAAGIAAAVGFFSVLLLTIYPLPERLDPISTRVIPSFKPSGDWPEIDVIDLLPPKAPDADEYLKRHGFEPMRHVTVLPDEEEKPGDAAMKEIASRDTPAQHAIPELPVETPGPPPQPLGNTVPDIALASAEAIRTYQTKAFCHDGTSYGVGLALDSGKNAQLLQAKAFLSFIGFDMCG